MTAGDVERRLVVEDQDDAQRGAGREPTSRAVLVCHRATPGRNPTAEWTYWDTIEEARQAEAELTPCGPYCIGCHTVVLVDVGTAARRPDRSHGPRSRKPRQQSTPVKSCEPAARS